MKMVSCNWRFRKRQTKQLLVKIISQLKDNHSTSPLQRTSPLKGTCFLAKTIVRFETYFIFFHLLPFTAFYFRWISRRNLIVYLNKNYNNLLEINRGGKHHFTKNHSDVIIVGKMILSGTRLRRCRLIWKVMLDCKLCQ